MAAFEQINFLEYMSIATGYYLSVTPEIYHCLCDKLMEPLKNINNCKSSQTILMPSYNIISIKQF